MRQLGYQQFLALREGAEVIEADHFGEKVLRLRDGNYLKLFRRKRLISSAAWYPYAQRFADNAGALAERGIPCPKVIDVFRIAEIGRDAVHYRPLEGATLRQLIAMGAADAALRRRLGSFVAKLHRKGVYFRSLHLGNIVRGTSGELGLIDIADMKVGTGPLGRMLRQRNMKPLLRTPEDRAWLSEKQGTDFNSAYEESGMKCGFEHALLQ